MSTTGVTTWVTDIGSLGPIYPFQGTELSIYIAGLVFWIGFHILQGIIEGKELQKEQAELQIPQNMRKALEFRDHQDRF